MPRIRARRSVLAALVTALLLVVPMACSDSSPDSQSTPTSTAAPPATSTPTSEPTVDCAAATELKSSLEMRCHEPSGQCPN
jgi:hypothetical protein